MACLLSLLVAFVTGRASARSNAETTALASAPPGLPYAVADFDGDNLPDMAAAEGGFASASVANYSIRFNLSGTGSLSIPLIAPAGGLSVEARDVNGDHILDLIVATTWKRQPVAVFLNDGHGSFSRVETSKFQTNFDSSEDPIVSAPSQKAGGVVALARELGSFCPPIRTTSGRQLQLRRIHKSAAVVAFDEFLAANSNRAPPSEVPSL